MGTFPYVRVDRYLRLNKVHGAEVLGRLLQHLLLLVRLDEHPGRASVCAALPAWQCGRPVAVNLGGAASRPFDL